MAHYPLYPERTALYLDGAWDFVWLGEHVNFSGIVPENISYDTISAVPGVFDTLPVKPGRRGVGVYRKIVEWAPDCQTRVRIGGMGLAGRIWWDGREVGVCRLPYSGVQYDFCSGPGRVHELVIAVDNRYRPESTPLFSPFFDLYGFGGIYRSVELQRLPKTRIERVQIKTLDLLSGLVELRIVFAGQLAGRVPLEIAFDRGEAMIQQAEVSAGVAVLQLNVPAFKTWSPANPHLHTVSVRFEGDRIVERFGIRTVATRGQQILVNGEPVRLRGVCRHESHPQFGPVQNTHLMLEDLRLLRELGCNFVRCVHYPQSQEFLDLCDEWGILVWEESLGWNDGAKRAADPDFFRLQNEQTARMVENSINHPAIIFWGFLNECCSDHDEGRRLYQSLAQTVRSRDDSRLVSYASNRVRNDICLDLADVISINIYPGWIHDTGDWITPVVEGVRPYVSEIANFIDSAGHSGKPLLISEIGACALYGCHDRAKAQWSEEFQAEFFAVACRSILDNPRYAGLALWQMFDTRSFVNAGEVRTKPRGFNCAGLLDEYRRPKLAFDAVAEIYRAEG